MSDEGWDFPAISYLWDPRMGAINAGADKLDTLSATARQRSVTALTERVADQVTRLDDGLLVGAAFFMVDDLYKSYFHQLKLSGTTVEYIRATAGVVMAELARRDFVVHYVIDNMESEAKIADRLTGVPLQLRAAGFMVTGPQIMALELMVRADHRPRDVRAIPIYRDEGKDLADRVIQSCHQERRPSVYLNMDLDDGAPPLSLEVALSVAGTPGAIVIYRNEAPVIGSKAHISLPPGVSLPHG
ncbi:hypothetical protein AWC02_00800 [Mycolicibacter engbaekii]|uniref:Uncharacterized protein n=1 Tax=Mycolicibacter engbaekii TaxID=188915 RepID=A0A1X1TAV3_9MYCO|nr:hypothetical protein [Mycolicibacter engbaekii]ORV41704.1 hypothetical protein AWC02_00800 [Mycolicibacter engbaekii]